MSQQSEDQLPDAEATRIAEYLLQHPDFLDQHPDVLAALDIPHDSGDAISLVHRQISSLRAQSGKYRQQLEELIEVARENERLSSRLHDLILALIEADSQDEILSTLQEQLREQFQTDAVELKLFSASAMKQHAEQGEAGPALFQDFMTRRRPSCGALPVGQLDYLFGDRAGETASVALIPLDAGNLEGLLAIGSRDAERFHPGQALDFLTRLGEIVSQALRVVAARNS